MNIYFSGIGGVGIGPLAEIAHDAGHNVIGSDMSETLVTRQLTEKGIVASLDQSGEFLTAQHEAKPIDWFVYTAALPDTHPELVKAKELGIRTGKRDEFLAEFIKAHNLKMIAIAGTHGKTSTTGMAVWAFKQLGIPVSYSVGTTLTFGPSGAYDPASEYFVYECDEFDRNFLHFSPEVSLITSIDYDHPDTYPTEENYKQAFVQYIEQSAQTFMWENDRAYIGAVSSTTVTVLDPMVALSADTLHIPGAHARRNATLVSELLKYLKNAPEERTVEILNTFPGTDRRFEKIDTNLYSDYGHHPKEIAATLQLAREVSPHVTLVYQPHQNVRQHEVKDDYVDAIFENADTVYWLPTYLTRENPDLATLTPEVLTAHLKDTDVSFVHLDDGLEYIISAARDKGSLVLCMGAGTVDSWVRAYAAK